MNVLVTNTSNLKKDPKAIVIGGVVIPSGVTTTVDSASIRVREKRLFDNGYLAFGAKPKVKTCKIVRAYPDGHDYSKYSDEELGSLVKTFGGKVSSRLENIAFLKQVR